MLLSCIRYFIGNLSVSSSTIIFRKNVDTNKAITVVITTKTSNFFGKEEMSFRICKKAIMKRNINNKNSKVDTIRLSPKKSKEERLLAENYGLVMEQELGKELRQMCNLSEAIEERGIKKGLKRGLKQGKAQGRAQGIQLSLIHI